MRDGHVLSDYEAVKPLRRRQPREADEPHSAAADGEEFLVPFAPRAAQEDRSGEAREQGSISRQKQKAKKTGTAPSESWVARRGHFISYIGLFLFTAFVFFRPYELFPLGWLTRGAEVLAIFTLLAYFPTQLAVEGNLTARPREVNLALLLLAAALLSVPLSISPGEAWEHFVEFLKVILVFVVMVNVVRTEGRLRGLLLLAMAVSIMLSYAAFSDFRSGRFDVGGERVKGMLGGLFGNPNDLALHLVTMAPLAVGLAFSRRGVVVKVFYLLCAALFVAGVVVTFSRGGFLGLVAATAVLAWKLGRKNRVVVSALLALALAVFIAASPGGYGERIKSLVGGDAMGSASARQELFWRSALVALRYPVFGVGIGNFYHKGQHNQVSHNAYTQVAAEMGVAALVVYIMFMWTSLRRLRRIEHEALNVKDRAKFYYLAVGLQGSLVAYMVSSFFASVAHLWYVYYLVGYAVCLRRLYTLKHSDLPPASAAKDAPAHEFSQARQSHAGAM